ncbi:putative prohibitin, Band 7 domain-containing protein [Helianthus annuus]|nr:putative prohibitin, Band 7 domain-containing protein [Helianthus annuus]
MGSNQAAVSFLTSLARAAFGIGTAATVDSPPPPYNVDGDQRSVLFGRFRGVIDDTVGEGTHFLIPWLQTPYIFDIRTRPHTFSSISGTKDLQMVNLTLRILSRPEVNNLPSIFKTLGLEYDEKVLPSIGSDPEINYYYNNENRRFYGSDPSYTTQIISNFYNSETKSPKFNPKGYRNKKRKLQQF